MGGPRGGVHVGELQAVGMGEPIGRVSDLTMVENNNGHSLYDWRATFFLEGFIPRVNELFIMSRLENFPQAVAHGMLDEVFEMLDESLLKHLPTLFKYKYVPASMLFKQQFHQIRATFEACVQRAAGARLNEAEARTLVVCESQLAFLTYIVGSLISSSRAIGSMGQDIEAVDAELCACVFQLLPAVEFRTAQNLSVPKSGHLELGILYSSMRFRKRYLGITRRVIINPEQDPTIFDRLSQHLQQATDENTMLAQIPSRSSETCGYGRLSQA